MSHSLRDRLLILVLGGCAGCAALVLLAIVGFLLGEAIPALAEPGLGRLLTDAPWRPQADRWGVLPLVAATLAVAAGALLIAAPIGVAIACWCHAYAPPRLAGAIRLVIDIAAAIPSVVYGFWGLVVLVPLLAPWSSSGQGQGLVAGCLILALIILPIAVVSADAAWRSVDPGVVAGGHALGLDRSAIEFGLVLPAIRRQLGVGIVLQASRAIGETMAVLMVCGNVVAWPDGPFASVRTLTANIARDMGEAQASHQSALFASGLLLVAIAGCLVLITELLRRKPSHASA